jgi:hypothetical protein
MHLLGLGAQDSFFIDNLRGVGRIYQQTFIDAYSGFAFAKLYRRVTPLTAADLLNDRVLPFVDRHQVPLVYMLTDRGNEYLSARDEHQYQLYLALESIRHVATQSKYPQGNPVCDSFHKLIVDDFYRHALRHTKYKAIAQLQLDLDLWLDRHNADKRPLGCFWNFPGAQPTRGPAAAR